MVVSADNPNLPWRAAFTPFYLLTILSAVMIWWMIYKKRSCEVTCTVLGAAVCTTTHTVTQCVGIHRCCCLPNNFLYVLTFCDILSVFSYLMCVCTYCIHANVCVVYVCTVCNFYKIHKLSLIYEHKQIQNFLFTLYYTYY